MTSWSLKFRVTTFSTAKLHVPFLLDLAGALPCFLIIFESLGALISNLLLLYFYPHPKAVWAVWGLHRKDMIITSYERDGYHLNGLDIIPALTIQYDHYLLTLAQEIVIAWKISTNTHRAMKDLQGHQRSKYHVKLMEHRMHVPCTQKGNGFY